MTLHLWNCRQKWGNEDQVGMDGSLGKWNLYIMPSEWFSSYTQTLPHRADCHSNSIVFSSENGCGDGSGVLETPSFPRANPVKARSLLRPWITRSPWLQQRGGISESILVERILSAGTPPLRQLSPTRWSTRSYLCVPICVHTCMPVLANTYLENVN